MLSLPMNPNPPAFCHRRAVEFHETDAAGLVHFTNLFRWMEAAESAFLRERGIALLTAGRDGERGWPRAAACAQFKAPVRLGDEVETRLRVLAAGRASVRYGFEIWRVSGERAPELAATGEISAVHVVRPKRGPLRPSPIPAPVKAILGEFLATGNAQHAEGA